MAHPEQMEFCKAVRERFPEHFKGKQVLDVGSLDINGNNRYLFTHCEYMGVDVGPGPNVDLVCPVHLYPGESQFDTIISTECFEHDEFWRESLRNIVRLLRPGGLFLFTCATTGRKEHGTRRTSPGDAPHCGDYYRNLTAEDVEPILEEHFPHGVFTYNDRTHDMYFWGIKWSAEELLRVIGELDEASEDWLRGAV